ncbi:uncharacterized protein LOC124780834 [Schistocerca piceifrons]|uniref:uncharacterized protein LOC124780834 n=1 Tax=Schistocerca piceifrons TaxID=274613 RepID=UPI001F5FEA31|nr:uncharacterized protein LOC124780834 [Schistocerca piceifrons]
METLYKLARIAICGRLQNALDVYQLELPQTIREDILLEFRFSKFSFMLNSYRLPECYIFDKSENVPMISEIVNDAVEACAKIRAGIPVPWETLGLITMSFFDISTFWQSRFKIKVFFYKVMYKHFVYTICENCLYKLSDSWQNPLLQPLLIGMRINMVTKTPSFSYGVTCPPHIKQYSHSCMFCANSPLFRSVLPILEYCSSVWDPHQVVSREDIEAIQRRAAGIITGGAVLRKASALQGRTVKGVQAAPGEFPHHQKHSGTSTLVAMLIRSEDGNEW